MAESNLQLDNRARAKALFQFLEEYSLLRYKTIKNTERYEYVSAFPPLPEANPWISWSFRDSNSCDAPLLEVKKPRYTACPRPMDSIRAWLSDDWDNFEKEVSLRVPQEHASDLDFDVEVRFHSDPGRVGDYEKWLEEREKWVETQQMTKTADGLFAQLFGIHADLERNSETMEFIAASMYFTLTNNKEINHPLLTKRIKISFDRENNVISLIDTDDQPRLYTELLNSIDDVNHASIRATESELAEAECHPFDRVTSKSIFKCLAHSLSSHGQFIESDDERIGMGTSLVIKSKYSLILRRKPSGAAQAMARVLNALDNGFEIPRHLLELIGGVVEVPAEPDEPDLSIEDRLAEVDGEARDILLAKPANHEQLEIARRIERCNAVLVQGPPGTGKTHTIANLIGHFLSQGKSILVSSYTSKALSVLKEKLPEEMQGLCVSAIEGTSKDMERSIDSIVEHQSEVTLHGLAREVDELSEQREAIICELAKVRRALFDDMEYEFEPIVYQGEKVSPLDAARFVGDNASELDGVIPGSIVDGAEFPLSDQELSDLYRGSAHLSEESELILEAFEGKAKLSDLIPPDEFRDLVHRLREARSHIDSTCLSSGWRYSQQEGGIELEADMGTIIVPNDVPLEEVSALREDLCQYSGAEPWVLAASADGLRGDDFAGLWKRLCSCVIKVDQISSDYALKVFGHEVTCPTEMNVAEVAEALRNRKQRLGKGKISSLLSSFFDSGRDTAADKVLVDGHTASTSEEFDLALSFLNLVEERVSCARCWDQLVAVHGGPSFNELDSLQPEHAANKLIPKIEKAISWYGDAKNCLRARFAALGIELASVLSDDQLLTEEKQVVALAGRIDGPLMSLSAILLDWAEISLFEKRLSCLEKTLLGLISKDSDLLVKAPSAVRNLDEETYEEVYVSISKALAERDEWLQRRALIQKIESVAPSWAQAVRLRDKGHEGPDMPARIRDAWRYKCYFAALSSLHSDSTASLQTRAAELSREYRAVTSRLASSRAWLNLLKRTQRDVSLNQALNGWKITMKRVGKGMGKHAPELRAQARRLMASCQRAVPCWIMPVDDAMSTFDPQTAHFDVLIIDEASQSDITSLALTALADKLIIVGDDKQVSPMAVGVDSQHAQTGIESHISGLIPNAHLYGPKTSLYDLAATTFQPLMLKEHFRCMPDIIGYCNLYSYDGKIKPLRDKGASNLIPSVVERYVEGGMRSANGKTNKKEAEETAAIIRSCLKQPEYQDKTFGVISLLGNEQATLVREELYRTLGPAKMEEHGILCGDAANFQGDERDVIILNLVDSNEGEGPIRLRSEGPDDSIKKRFNVAVSRARDQLWVVHSLDVTKDLKTGDLRRALIEYAKNPQELAGRLASAEAAAESPFESEVAKALIACGYELFQQYPVGAYRIDIAILDGSRRIAIECDGERWHSGEKKILEDLERQTVLERLGWQFVRIRGSRYYANKKAALEELFNQLEAMDVLPNGSKNEERLSSDLLQRVLFEVNQLTDKRSSLDSDALRGTRFRESVIEDALGENGYEGATNPNPIAHSSYESAPGKAKQSEIAARALPIKKTAPKAKPVNQTRTPETPSRFSRSNPVKKSYVMANLPSYPLDNPSEYGTGQSRAIALSRMEKAIEIEGPIELNELIRRVRESFGLKRAGIDIANKSMELLEKVPHDTTRFNGRVFVWPAEVKNNEVAFFRVNGKDANRLIEEVCPEELVAALRYVLLRSARGLDEESLIKEAGRALGFRRSGGRITSTLRAALKLACEDHAIVFSLGTYHA